MGEVEGENHQLPDDQEAQKQQGRRDVIPERGMRFGRPAERPSNRPWTSCPARRNPRLGSEAERKRLPAIRRPPNRPFPALEPSRWSLRPSTKKAVSH